MIKILLKHFIFELCIEKIFEGIEDNFRLHRVNLSNYSVGDYLTMRLMLQDKDIVFKDCKIVYKKKGKVAILVKDLQFPSVVLLRDGMFVDMILDGKHDTYEECFENYG